MRIKLVLMFLWKRSHVSLEVEEELLEQRLSSGTQRVVANLSPVWSAAESDDLSPEE